MLTDQQAAILPEYGNKRTTPISNAYSVLTKRSIFSKRETEILFWMAEGLTSKEIALKLYVSEHTIINHRKNMQEKSGVPNAVALVSYAIRNGFI
ncbi:regulatory protein, luxR family [bacterium A37T11]|nr:regulatory protein, luxR family [bacterium A37T11]